jgi:mRNA-degrading endonuclease toxin of MazEF toxin-antitoxin module
MSTVEEVLALAQTLSEAEQCELIMLISKGLKKSIGKKVKKERDPDAPKRAVKSDSYIFLTNSVVWPILKALSESEDDAEEKKLIRDVSARTQVSKAIWETLKSLDSEERAAKIAEVSEEEVKAAFAEWKTIPRPSAEEKKAAREEKKAAKATSVTSKSSKSSDEEKPKKVKKEVSEEEKADKKKERAEKAAAKKTAKVKEPEPEEDAESEEVAAYKWKHDFGKGETEYERMDHEGMAYIYDIKTKAYLGAFIEKTNKLNKAIPDPTAE